MRRTVFFVRRRYFILVDQVTSAREHRYDWILHGNSEDLDYFPGGWRWIVGKARLAVFNLLPSGLPWRFEAAFDTTETELYHRVPKNHAVLHCWTAGSMATFVTALIVDDVDKPLPEAVVINHDPLAVRVQLAGDKQEDVFIWNPGDKKRTIELPGVGKVALTAPATVVRRAKAPKAGRRG